MASYSFLFTDCPSQLRRLRRAHEPAFAVLSGVLVHPVLVALVQDQRPRNALGLSFDSNTYKPSTLFYVIPELSSCQGWCGRRRGNCVDF
jgi:hypothetical protein